MAEDDGDKTEAPTPRRRQEAREQGNIARSHDLTAAMLLIATLMLLNSTGSQIVFALRSLLAHSLGSALRELSPMAALQSLGRALVQVGISLLPLLIGVFIVAILANVLQVGLYFSPARLQPNLAALNPFKGVGSLFSRRLKPAKMLLDVGKFAALILVTYSTIRNRVMQIVQAQQLSFRDAFLMGAQTFYAVALRLAIALLIIAILEYIYQRWQLEQELKMSKSEVKEEMRRMDGDPKVKARRRQIAMQMLKKQLQKDVPTADVVVTNPTEFAIAIKYDQTLMHAPRVVAKGRGPIAQRIREIAVAHGVPILERKPLARALYKLVEVGQEIPEQFYSAVAEILAYVYELSGKARKAS